MMTSEVREHLAAVVDSSDDAIISKALDGTITAWNHGAEKIFGYSAAEAIGQPMLTLFPPDRVNEESDILERIRRGDNVDHFETVRVRKDDRRIDSNFDFAETFGKGRHLLGELQTATVEIANVARKAFDIGKVV